METAEEAESNTDVESDTDIYNARNNASDVSDSASASSDDSSMVESDVADLGPETAVWVLNTVSGIVHKAQMECGFGSLSLACR